MDTKRLSTTLNIEGYIRISINTLELLNYPKYIRLLINESEHKIAYEPCDKSDRRKILIKYSNTTMTLGKYINSAMFTKKVFEIEKWDKAFRYQIPGKFVDELKLIIFDLKRAVPVKNNTSSDDDEDDGLDYDIDFEKENK